MRDCMYEFFKVIINGTESKEIGIDVVRAILEDQRAIPRWM